MRIGFITDHIYYSVPGGIGCYSKNLISNLIDRNGSVKYILINSNKTIGKDLFDKEPLNKCETAAVPIPSPYIYLLWHNFNFPKIEYFTGTLDILHAPLLLAPSCRADLVVTIHDLCSIRFPKFYGKWAYNFHKLSLKKVSDRAKAIITVSQSTKNDILEYTKIEENKISVIYEGVSDKFRPIRDQDFLRGLLVKYGLAKPYILFVGTLEPRKNIHRLLEAYSRFKRSSAASCKLVILGKKGWFYNSIFDKVKYLGLSDSVIFLDNVTHDDLPGIINSAELFVYPSLYEGFGLPPLEAMACGIPVLTSNVSSLPEVVGDGAVLVDPLDIDDIARGIYNCTFDKGLRERLVNLGLSQASKFSWKKTAEKTENVYHNLFKNRTVK